MSKILGPYIFIFWSLNNQQVQYHFIIWHHNGKDPYRDRPLCITRESCFNRSLQSHQTPFTKNTILPHRMPQLLSSVNLFVSLCGLGVLTHFQNPNNKFWWTYFYELRSNKSWVMFISYTMYFSSSSVILQYKISHFSHISILPTCSYSLHYIWQMRLAWRASCYQLWFVTCPCEQKDKRKINKEPNQTTALKNCSLHFFYSSVSRMLLLIFQVCRCWN